MSKQTQTAIAKILADCKVGDLFTITFATSTDPVWIVTDEYGVAFRDANGDQVYARHMGPIATGRAIDVEVINQRDGMTAMCCTGGDYLWIKAKHLRSIAPRVSPFTTAKIADLDYDMEFNVKTGECKVGCQTLTRAGCQQVFVALASHLGYELSE